MTLLVDAVGENFAHSSRETYATKAAESKFESGPEAA